MIPPRDALIIHFAHPAYRLAERFAERDTGIRHFQTWTFDETRERLGEGEVMVCSGFWEDGFLERAPDLRFIQVCAAGYDRFGLERLREREVLLANGRGVNANAVSEHALGLVLAFTRQLHTGRDHQRAHHWRGMISDLARREEELPGKTLLVYGLGAIGSRIARLARAFDMHVVAIKRDPTRHDGEAHEVHPPSAFLELLPRADFVVLACPLTPETTNLIDARALAAMRPEARLVNVARGGCVDQDALLEALDAGRIAGAALDVTVPEPLPPDSPLWDRENVILLSHTGGETRRYEDNVVDLLLENLERLWRGDDALRNRIV